LILQKIPSLKGNWKNEKNLPRHLPLEADLASLAFLAFAFSAALASLLFYFGSAFFPPILMMIRDKFSTE